MIENALPEEIKDRYEKATMAIDKKNYDYAIELLTQIINIKPDFAKGRQLLRLAEIRKFEENTPNIIIRVISRALSCFAVLMAIVNETKGDHHAAITSYENILRRDPKNTAVLVKLGKLLNIEGMKEASAVTLESTVNISAKNPIAYEILGEVYSDLGNYDRARFCFKKVLELRPHDTNAERGLKNIDALTTIDKSFDKKDDGGFRIREIKE
jgi:tetratricopeptide (TPR) repeat protein